MIYSPGTYWPTNIECRGQFVHQSCNGTSSLKYIITPEGMLKNKDTNAVPIWEWNYNLTDHLGNVRTVFRPTATNGVEKLSHTNYLPFGLKMQYPYSSASASNYLYNGKELQGDGGLDLYDYGARFYDPALGRWTVTDPLMESHFEISPYVYCANNPIKFVDPNGLDWVSRNVNGFTEAYYDRDVKSQDDINNKYGDKSGVTHMSDGTTLTNYDKAGKIKSQYTFTNDSKENKYGTVTDINGDKLDNTQITNGNNYTIFGTSDNSVNAETLHKNYMGTSYTGPHNPKDYDGFDSYQYQPRNKSEYASMFHDNEYQKKQASGVEGALFDTRVIGADIRLAARNGLTALNPFVSPIDRLRALATYNAFGAISIFKIELLILKGGH